MSKHFCFALIIGFFASLSSVQADLILGLQLDGPSTITSGQTVNIDLTITDTDGSTPFPAEGLFSAGGRLLQTAGSLVMSLNSVTDVDGNWTAGGLDTNPDSAGGAAEIAKGFGFTDLFVGPAVGMVAGVSSTVKIARFAFTVTGLAGQSTTISADILGGVFDGIATFDTGTILDGAITSFGSIDLTIAGPTAVPEPASMILATLTAGIAGGVGYRRRRQLAKNTAV